MLVAARGIFVAVHRILSSCGARAPEHSDSVVVARGRSCPAACGILVPRPGIEPESPVLEGRFLTTGLPGKSPHPCWYLLLFVFLIIAILVDVKWYHIMVLTCISLMTKDVERVFKCLSAICISSLEKFLFRSFLYFYSGLFVFLLLSCKNSS